MPQKLNLCSGEGSDTAGTLPFREFSSDELISLAVLTSSKGNQQKYKTKDDKYYVKECFNYRCTLWQDNLVEVAASQYAASCHLPAEVRVVRQGPCKVDGRSASYSEAFDTEGDYFISYSRAMGDKLNDPRYLHFSASDWMKYIYNTYSELIGMDASSYLTAMTLLDAVVGNEDRHLNNFGFCCTQESQLSPSPLFDFGLGLFEANDYRCDHPGVPLSKALRHLRLKPWNAKLETVLELLLDQYSNLVYTILPLKVYLDDYTFPSGIARSYFKWVNERLGVEVV